MDKLITLVLVFAYAFTAQSAPSLRLENETIECSDIEALDKATLHLLGYGDRCHKPPVTSDELDNDYCPRTKTALKEMQTFAEKCFKPAPQHVFGMILRGAELELSKTCDFGRELTLKANKCTEGKDFEAYHQCSDTYTRQLEAIEKFEDKAMKAQYTCCLFYSFRQCILGETEKFGCDAIAIFHYERYLKSITSEALDHGCANYNEQAGCSILPELSLESAQVSRSFVPPLVNIITSLSEENVRRDVAQ
ncbi:hypothetical protein HDE_10470 [Halotydeus destructor]|nr:hypothetical protein HDE_10470 [Halotydeus destructor]